MEQPFQETKILRCRLCFHTGDNYQLVEVFTKSHDLSKRVISALGVKINRSEKHARICTVCETLIDIIQSFQAVCKQTNQLHHSRTDFLLYDTFWNSQEQDAVKVTEKMVLAHRSEVDKTISGTITIPAKPEPERLPIVSAKIEKPPDEVENDVPKASSDVLKTEIVMCESPIKDEPLDDDSKNDPHTDLEEHDVDDICELDTNLDSKPDVPSDSEPESIKISKNIRAKKRRGKTKYESIEEKESENEKCTRSSRKKRIVDENEQSESEYEPKIPGKRGPRRKKVRKSDPSVCDICGQTVAHFVKESHHNQHLGVRPYKCEFEGCGRSYFSQNDLRTHSKRHQITYHVCEICGRNIKGVEWFRRHVKTHTEGPQFTCEVCGSKFRRKAQLQTHMVTHTGLTPHECDTCGKRFALRYNLEAHVKRHQKKEDCVPEKLASEKRTWKYYVRAEDSGLKHHVTCETCGSSVHKREIEGHVNKHLGRRPYSCDVTGCTLAFYGLRGIKEHKMVVHSDKILRYDCSVCNRSIKGAGTFKRHVMMHNSNMKVECQHCGKKFTSKSYLKAHEQKHSGERPYICELCGRSFAMKPCWKMHMKTVHNEDHREPTRIRKRESDGAGKQTSPSIPVNSSLPPVAEEPKPSSASSLSLQVQTIDHQSLSHSQPLQQQPVLQTSHYPTPDPVRTEYSY